MTVPAETDVLVVGGGNAALCAAIAAREAGARVLVLEHAPRALRGGNTRHTRNLRASHGGPAHTLTDSYPDEAFWQDLLRVTEGHTNEALARQMIAASGSMLDWLHDRGVRFQDALRGTLNLSHSNAFFLGGGKAYLNALYRTAERAGVVVRYDCEVTGFDIDAGRFRGATCVRAGAEHELRAGALVVASGGFQSNPEWMRDAWGDAADRFLIRGTPYNRGAPLRCLMAAGAATVGEPTQCHAVAIDARGPRYDGGIVTRLDCVCFGVVVNLEGQRFYDEGEDFWPRRYAIWGRLVAAQPGQRAWAIVDADVMHQFMPSVYPPVRADSVEELAGLMEVDARVLADTLEGFNASVQPGHYDPDVLDGCRTEGLTPPKTNWARRIETPPFHAWPLAPGITFTYLGVQVDAGARVQFDGAPSPNVFAAGEVMAGNILGKGYCAGTGMTIGAVFGKLAGEGAACATTG